MARKDGENGSMLDGIVLTILFILVLICEFAVAG